MLKNLSKPMQYALVGLLVVVCYVVLQPMLFPADATPKSVKKPTAKKSSVNGKTIITEEDLQAFKTKFQPVTASVKNSFKPLVAKAVGPSATGPGPVRNAVPASFAGGDANWTYTGTVEIDGVLQALIENKATGDNVFLKIGEHWKGISVEEITDDTLVLMSADGESATLHLATDDNTISPASSTPTGTAPVTITPPLRGNIGFRNLSLRPDSANGRDANDNGDHNAN